MEMASFLFIRWFSMIMCKIGQDTPLERMCRSLKAKRGWMQM
ncbi:Uncharacterised protein [uncultured Clostridium sp.]